ncbi:hypothetical protein [Haloglomus halophilum]|uniref:hypothetical protein n=1 Tax=Haloglomus halophilum TaxID=2962672 RepID=UPI0020CA09EF|nr:hypothetical protein [Haloglomus halophilum]
MDRSHAALVLVLVLVAASVLQVAALPGRATGQSGDGVPATVTDGEVFTVRTGSIVLEPGGSICASELASERNRVTIENAVLKEVSLWHEGELPMRLAIPRGETDETMLYTNGENDLVDALAELDACLHLSQPLPVTLEAYYMESDVLNARGMELVTGSDEVGSVPDPGGLRVGDLLSQTGTPDSATATPEGTSPAETDVPERTPTDADATTRTAASDSSPTPTAASDSSPTPGPATPPATASATRTAAATATPTTHTTGTGVSTAAPTAGATTTATSTVETSVDTPVTAPPSPSPTSTAGLTPTPDTATATTESAATRGSPTTTATAVSTSTSAPAATATETPAAAPMPTATGTPVASASPTDTSTATPTATSTATPADDDDGWWLFGGDDSDDGLL